MGFYYSASDFFKEKFGRKIYKISLDGGCSCPTRDGTLDTRGCIFCSGRGSGDFAPFPGLSVSEQIEEGKALVIKKLGRKRPDMSRRNFIAYFQNYTNTYGNPGRLYSMYLEALNHKDIAGLDIATRPDCLNTEILRYIGELAGKNFVIVELGLQTTNEKTASYIRRGFNNEVYFDAVKKLHDTCSSIHVVTHTIFYLPGETEADMIKTVEDSVNAGTDGIKISLLHVLKGTDLAEDYKKGLFTLPEMEEYFSVISKAIKKIPENIVIHRLTGDGPKNLLIAPLWTGEKKKVLNAMNKYFFSNNVYQGRN